VPGRRRELSFWDWKIPARLCDRCWELRPDARSRIVIGQDFDGSLDGGQYDSSDGYYEQCRWVHCADIKIRDCTLFGSVIDNFRSKVDTLRSRVGIFDFIGENTRLSKGVFSFAAVVKVDPADIVAHPGFSADVQAEGHEESNDELE